MPDRCIVTVRTQNGAFEIDLDMPSGVPFGELRGDLLGILKSLCEAEFAHWADCNLQHRSRVFGEKDTLMGVGAFDGSILTVSKR